MKKRMFTAISMITICAMLFAGCGSAAKAPSEGASRKESRSSETASVRESSAKPAATKTPAATETPAAPISETPLPDVTDRSAGSAAKTNSEMPTAATEEIYIEETEAYYPGDAYEAAYDEYPYYEEDFNTEEYNAVEENGFRKVSVSPLSTFAADVDTASYANLRRMLNWGYTLDEIPSGAVRAEEMINYFSYHYDGPKDGEPFGVNAEICDCPWNEDHKLLMLGLQTEAIDLSEAPDTNLVFLIDVSGSMDEPDKLPLLKQAFTMLAEELGENDRVSIVTYASSNDIVLEGARGDQTKKITRAINKLEAYGSTNGGEGIITAYELAEEYYIEGGNNRVIIASDGDFNVGITSESELYDLIRKEKEKGIFLSVLGFGYGNYSDARMETLADNGDGNYSYIDSEKEARKVLVEELGANLFTVAKDVKLQIEFNPAYVAEYRQIGYENRAMAAEDFDDDKKDGGEIGAGHSVTVLYELVPVGKEEKSKGLKYQEQSLTEDAEDSGEWLTLSVRYKEPDEDESKLLEYPVGEESVTKKPSEDFIFAAAVAEFAMVLSDSEYIGDGSLRHVKKILDEVDPADDYQEEFIDLVYMLR